MEALEELALLVLRFGVEEQQPYRRRTLQPTAERFERLLQRAPVGGVVVADVAGELEFAGLILHQEIGETLLVPVTPGVDFEQRGDAVAEILLVAFHGGEGAVELLLLLLREAGDEEERRHR